MKKEYKKDIIYDILVDGLSLKELDKIVNFNDSRFYPDYNGGAFYCRKCDTFSMDNNACPCSESIQEDIVYDSINNIFNTENKIDLFIDFINDPSNYDKDSNYEKLKKKLFNMLDTSKYIKDEIDWNSDDEYIGCDQEERDLKDEIVLFLSDTIDFNLLIKKYNINPEGIELRMNNGEEEFYCNKCNSFENTGNCNHIGIKEIEKNIEKNISYSYRLYSKIEKLFKTKITNRDNLELFSDDKKINIKKLNIFIKTL